MGKYGAMRIGHGHYLECNLRPCIAYSKFMPVIIYLQCTQISHMVPVEPVPAEKPIQSWFLLSLLGKNAAEITTLIRPVEIRLWVAFEFHTHYPSEGSFQICEIAPGSDALDL